MKTLTDAVPELYSRREAYNVREKGKDAVRTNFAAHLYSEPFARLARHPRMVEPVQDLLGEALYMHQFKINGKQAFDGDVWQWHQDYGTWLNDDKMPAERAMNVAIFLDDVNDYNGPLMFIPGSHKRGVVDAKHDLTTTSYPLWTIDNDLIGQLVERAGGKNGGIVSPKGPAGSMILFHGCLMHASGSNLSPWNRVAVYLSLCAVSQPHPPLQAPRVHRPPRLHADHHPARRLPAEGLPGRAAMEERDAGERARDVDRRAQAGGLNYGRIGPAGLSAPLMSPDPALRAGSPPNTSLRRAPHRPDPRRPFASTTKRARAPGMGRPPQRSIRRRRPP